LSVYAEFVAVYLELRHFDPGILPLYFPSIPENSGVAASLEEDIGAKTLFQTTRLRNAADPLAPGNDRETSQPGVSEKKPAPGDTRAAEKRAAVAATAGNAAPSPFPRGGIGRAATADLEKLGERLGAALQMESDEAERWRGCLGSLL